MQRYFVETRQFQADTVTIGGEDARHIGKVMRCRPGDQLIVSDGATREVLGEIHSIRSEEVVVHIVDERAMENEPQIDIWIAQALPKADKMETVIQKCTEIGAARIIPFESARTIVQYDERKAAKRRERWRKIAKEAAEQSHRNRIPAIDEAYTWKQMLELVPQAGKAWICYEKNTGSGLKQSLRQYIKQNEREHAPLLLIIGPEGGFEPQEIAAVEKAGGECVSLGKRILRTETAAMVGLSCILYEYDEIGGVR